MAMQHIFAQSLLRMGSAKWKTLKQAMFEKKIFAAFYGPLCLRCSLPLRIAAIVRIKRRGKSGILCADAVTPLVHK